MFPLNRRGMRRFLFVFALSLLLTNVAVADVELKASWTKGREHWLVHIQVARAGFFIFDISKPATPKPVGFCDMPGSGPHRFGVEPAFVVTFVDGQDSRPPAECGEVRREQTHTMSRRRRIGRKVRADHQHSAHNPDRDALGDTDADSAKYSRSY